MQNFLIDSAFFGAVISLAAYEGGLLLKKKYRLAILYCDNPNIRET